MNLFISKLKGLLRTQVPDWLRVRYSTSKMVRKLPGDISKILKTIRSNDLVIDCGAHLGFSSMMFARFAGQVISFEPDPYIFSLNQRNTRFARNILTINAAVANTSGSKFLYRHPNFDANPLAMSQASSLMKNKPNVDGSKPFEVRSIDLVEFLRAIGKVKILKIDIEGYEVELIEDMLNRDAFENVEYIFVEFHDDKFPELAKRTASLKKSIAEREMQDKFLYNWI